VKCAGGLECITRNAAVQVSPRGLRLRVCLQSCGLLQNRRHFPAYLCLGKIFDESCTTAEPISAYASAVRSIATINDGAPAGMDATYCHRNQDGRHEWKNHDWAKRVPGKQARQGLRLLPFLFQRGVSCC
jgi:hypothetical protein